MNTSVATNSPAFVSNPLRPKADYGRASFDVGTPRFSRRRTICPLAERTQRTANGWVNRLIRDWQVSGIVTLQSGLPFTPQLSYNPSNDGDTRNPVRPSWNPAFTGPVILGGPDQYFNPLAFTPTTTGHLRQRRAKRFARARPCADRPLPVEEILIVRASRFAVPRRVLQPFQSHKLQHAESGRVRGRDRRTISHSWCDYFNRDEFAASSIGAEAILVVVQLRSANNAIASGVLPRLSRASPRSM